MATYRALRRSTLPVEAVSAYVADGDAAGQEVAHVHIHLIPRNAHDHFGFRFLPGYGVEPERSELERLAGEIRPDNPSTNFSGAGGD
jgi:diadenosine tetraphosphate (Ap4A) HIT family hydrolase